MRCGIETGDPRISPHGTGFSRRAAVAGKAPAGHSRMVHLPAEERAGVSVAALARQFRRKVIRRFAHHPQGLPIVASCAIARYADMLVTLHQEVRRADVAGIAGAGGGYVIDGLRRRRNPGAGRVASGTILGRVLENSVDVALLALQGGVHVLKYKPRFRVIERNRLLRLNGGQRLGKRN